MRIERQQRHDHDHGAAGAPPASEALKH
jgi:hypothetical protein